MNDRFKFRCYNKFQEKMFDVKSMSYINGIVQRIEVQDDDRILIFDEWQNNIDNTVLMQCTGLKDKNGKLIYEGDILGGSYGNLYIHYCDECMQFQLKAKDYGCMACEGDVHWCEVVESEDENELEVIGNIYENPERLED